MYPGKRESSGNKADEYVHSLDCVYGCVKSMVWNCKSLQLMTMDRTSFSVRVAFPKAGESKSRILLSKSRIPLHHNDIFGPQVKKVGRRCGEARRMRTLTLSTRSRSHTM